MNSCSDIEAAACVCGARQQANPNPCCKDALGKAMAAIRQLRHELTQEELLCARVLAILDVSKAKPGESQASKNKEAFSAICAAARESGLLP